MRRPSWCSAPATSGAEDHAHGIEHDLARPVVDLRKDLADDPLLYSVQAILYAASNNVTAAEDRIERAKRSDSHFLHHHHIAYNIGSAYALLGRNTEAITWLKMAADNGFPCYEFFEIDPNLQKIRGDPSFKVWMQEQRRRYENNKATLRIITQR